MRHWKQQFSADADFIFARTMKLGCCGVDMVQRGDPVTAEIKASLGRNRLRRWWDSNQIELANFDGDLGRVVEPKKVPKKKKKSSQDNLDTDHNLGGPF